VENARRRLEGPAPLRPCRNLRCCFSKEAEKKVKRQILILAVILLNAIIAGCSAQSGVVGPADTRDLPATSRNPKLWLNDEPMGSIDDPSKLVSAISKIMKDRMEEGVFEDDPREDLPLTAPVTYFVNGVYLNIGPDVSMGDLGKLFTFLGEECVIQLPGGGRLSNQCRIQIPRLAALSNAPSETRLNPYLLVVSIGGEKGNTKSIQQFPSVDIEYKYSYNLMPFEISEPDNLRFDRVLGSVEMLSDGSLVINSRDNGQGLVGSYPPTTRPLGSALKDEISDATQEVEKGKYYLRVIVHHSISYRQFEQILRLADERDFSLIVGINMLD